ncbi:MAG: hypothetical protein IVW55_16420 [Chloroflexi bacterium]|nr:hypothetical protein [Chloroflexota bacterium]
MSRYPTKRPAPGYVILSSEPRVPGGAPRHTLWVRTSEDALERVAHRTFTRRSDAVAYSYEHALAQLSRPQASA